MAGGPDSGRAWFVAVACMVIYLICAGTFRSQGLLFVEFMSVYDVDRKLASLPFSIRSSIRNLLAPAAGIVGQKYGIATVTVIGGILSSISCALCYFAPDIVWLTVIWGGLNGLGMALITILPPVVIGQYFLKHRTTATGISFSGSCVGAFVFPLLFETLLMHYGLHGTFLILAGLMMHVIPAAMLFTKPKWAIESGNRESTDNQKDPECPMDKNESRNGLNVANGGVNIVTQNNNDIHTKVTFHLGDDFESNHHHHLPSSKAMNSLYPVHESTFGQGNSHLSSVATISSLSLNNRLLKSSTDNFFDIDLDYLKQMTDLLFHMFSMDLPNMEMSYRAILLEVDQDDLWHPEKHEIIQEIESMYLHLEKSLDFDEISESTIRANGLYIKRTKMSEALTASKKSQSLRAVRKYFRTHKGRALPFGKHRSAPNISNIYTELVRKDYILSKLRMLCNSNEIRIISHLSEYNPRDVLKVLFQVRCLYMLHHDLESTDQDEISELTESSSEQQLCDTDVSVKSVEIPITKTTDEKPPVDNTLIYHIKNALKLHTNPLFLLICFTRTVFFITFNPVITTIVDFTMDRGLPEADGKFTIIALSIGDLIGRLGFGWITDRGYATLPRFMLSALILLGMCCISIPLLHAKWTLLPSIALFGMLQGTLFIRHPVLVSKYMKAHEQSIAVGCMEFSSGIIGLLVPLYIGYFRDVVGSYNPLYFINGAFAILSGLSWILEPCFLKRMTSQA